MKIEIKTDGSTIQCKVDGNPLQLCDALTKARVSSTFNTLIKNEIRK